MIWKENKLSRPGSGYLFRGIAEKSRSSGSQNWFNLQYFNGSNSSLNRSFVESNEGVSQVKNIPIGFKIFCVWVAAFCNSTFPIFPFYIWNKFYQSDAVDTKDPILINCWRLQWVSFFFISFGLIRRIFWLDDYFRRERFSKLMMHSFIGGFSLSIWSTGVMYGAQMDSLFTSFLIGYSFSVTVSTITLLIGAAYIKDIVSKHKNNNEEEIKENLNENIEENSKHHEPSKFRPHEAQEEINLEPHHISFNHKLGLGIFIVGVLVIIISNLISTEGSHSSASIRIAGIFISMLSSLFGALFYFVFAHYSKKSLYRIIEYLICMYFYAALTMTIIWALFVDRSSFKHMSLVGWIYYSNNSYGWILWFLVMGVINGLGINMARLVKAEKYISSK